jgi:hypothetical protein
MKGLAKNVTWHFAFSWINDRLKPTPPYSHLVPAFQAAIASQPNGKWMAYYVGYAFLKEDVYFHSLSLDEAVKQFIKQLPKLIGRYHDEYPDSEPIEWARVEIEVEGEGRGSGAARGRRTKRTHRGHARRHGDHGGVSGVRVESGR